jgi:hypothetical protein
MFAEQVAEARNPSSWRTDISELDNLWTTTSDELDRGRQSYGDMPLVVLTAGDGFAGVPAGRARDAVRETWAGFHRQIAAKSSRGSAQLVANSSHMMIFDRPDAIIAAIEEVRGAARSPGAAPAKAP